MDRGALVLDRKAGQRIVIGEGDSQIGIKVVKMSDGRVRLLIEAPRSVPVVRAETLERGGADANA